MAGRGVIAAAVVCATLLVAGSADAGVPHAEVHDAQAIAARAMHQPCSGSVRVRFWRLRSDTLGVAKWDGMWDIPSDQRTGCEVVLNSRKAWPWTTLCTTVVHEYGHLAGRGHSDRPGSVMDPRYQRPFSGCVHAAAARRWD